MEVLTCTKPGQFVYTSAPEPASEKDMAIIAIKRIGICGTDLHAFEGTQPYFSYPRVLGHELAGEVADASFAPGFSAGEPVTVIPYLHCGHCVACRNGLTNCCTSLQVLGVHVDGGMAAYLRVPSHTLVHADGLSPDELALVEPLAIGAHGVRRAAVKPGEFVLVVGAGPIGLAVMQFAVLAGAEVIALDVNEKRLNFCCEKLGVKNGIHALSDDVPARLNQITNGDMPTAIIDATGNLKAINASFNYLAHGGRYVLVGLQKGEISVNHPGFHKREATLMSSRNATRADFTQVISAIKNRKIDPMIWITHRFDFSEIAVNFPGLIKPETGVIKAMIELKTP